MCLEDKGLRLLLPAEQKYALVPLAFVLRRGALKALLPSCGAQHEAEQTTPCEAGIWLVSS